MRSPAYAPDSAAFGSFSSATMASNSADFVSTISILGFCRTLRMPSLMSTLSNTACANTEAGIHRMDAKRTACFHVTTHGHAEKPSWSVIVPWVSFSTAMT